MSRRFSQRSRSRSKTDNRFKTPRTAKLTKQSRATDSFFKALPTGRSAIASSSRETKRIRRTASVVIPSALDFFGDRDTVIEVLSELRRKILVDNYDQVSLDLRNLNTITPDAALLLLAEIDRCQQLRLGSGFQISGNHPASKDACRTLRDLGYFDFFGVKPPEMDASDAFTLRVKTGNTTDGKTANDLIKVFDQMIQMGSLTRRSMYNALIECMQNVSHHAYLSKRLKNKIPYRWWMVGYGMRSTGEVSFLFYDQGAGIPATLKTKWRSLLTGLNYTKDSAIIDAAITGHESRLRSVRRGNGLTTLRTLLNMAPEGEFRIHSNAATVCYRRHTSEPKLEDSNRSVDGTLIVWTLFPKKNETWYELATPEPKDEQ